MMQHGTKTVAATAAALIGFAANSLLCRLALRSEAIDPVAFTGVRIVSGAATLWIVCAFSRAPRRAGSWSGALALFAYAITFSLAVLGRDICPPNMRPE